MVAGDHVEYIKRSRFIDSDRFEMRTEHFQDTSHNLLRDYDNVVVGNTSDEGLPRRNFF